MGRGSDRMADQAGAWATMAGGPLDAPEASAPAPDDAPGDALTDARPAALARLDGLSLDAYLRRVEAECIASALVASRGNKSLAARLLGVKRSTLGDRIARCGVGRQ